MKQRLSFSARLVLCGGLVFLALLVGLWPFNFRARNEISWAKDGSGIICGGGTKRKDCRGGGALKSSGPMIMLQGGAIEGKGVTIALWIEPYREPMGCRAKILTFYDSSGNEVFFIGQWRSHLLVRGNLTKRNGESVFREIGVADALIRGKKKFITICSGSEGTDFYVDGNFVKRYRGIRLFRSIQNFSRLHGCIGNDLNATASWVGKILGLGFYRGILTQRQVRENIQWWKECRKEFVLNNRALSTYRFDEGEGDLCKSGVQGGATFLIPDKFPLEKRLLKVSNPFSHPIRDLVINFLGFIPIGLSFCLLLTGGKGKAVSKANVIAVAVAAGLLLSLCIEWAQVYLPTRDSSLTDLLVNTLGATAGAVLWVWEEKCFVTLEKK